MQSQSKSVAINTRRIILEMLSLAGRAFAVGIVVSLLAASLTVAVVILAS